jgi:hypothetical protein
MKKLIQLIKVKIVKLWKTDGLKRTIALTYWSVLTPCLPILWPAQIPSVVNKAYMIIGIILSAVGLGHAAVKRYMNGNGNDDGSVKE